MGNAILIAFENEIIPVLALTTLLANLVKIVFFSHAIRANSV